MKTKWMVGLMGACLMGMAGVARGQAGWTSPLDRTFTQQFLSTSLEIQRIGRMAQTQSQNAQVIGLGQRLAQDYYQALAEVAANARALGLGGNFQMSSNAVEEVNKLADLSGPAFDQASLRVLMAREQVAAQLLTLEAGHAGNLALHQIATVLQLDLAPILARTTQLNALLTNAGGPGSLGPGS